MYLAMFGPKGFTVSSNKVITFDEFSSNSSLETEKQESKDKKPSTYIKGAGLDTFSVKVRLDRALGVYPMAQIEDWMSIKDKAEAYPFLLNGKPFLNTKWILKSVGISETHIDNTGYMIAATLTLSFEEFVRAGSAQASKKNKKTTSKSGSKSKKAANTESIYNALSPSQKANMTRTSTSQAPSVKPSTERM
ncbi:phage tail protein [Zhenhengia yiwuensis]|uniref:Phage tail protein n=1 Tax=Zhenhengia yiwuensis TaxID=2763666 RepID=A0A926EMD3_9FIRM|nr:phage tail protein [Zhenhengia yiwuensis]MBC8581115.1 phage tail protein [Zhenhengia yiwuensis]